MKNNSNKDLNGSSGKKKDKKAGVPYPIIEKRKKKQIKELREGVKQIHSVLEEKDWASIKGTDAWAIFKIMAELVEGFEKLAKIGPCITIFGSARTPENHKYYKMAQTIATMLVENGYGVITGGGPGIMEAANKGARDASGKSVGLRIPSRKK